MAAARREPVMANFGANRYDKRPCRRGGTSSSHTGSRSSGPKSASVLNPPWIGTTQSLPIIFAVAKATMAPTNPLPASQETREKLAKANGGWEIMRVSNCRKPRSKQLVKCRLTALPQNACPIELRAKSVCRTLLSNSSLSRLWRLVGLPFSHLPDFHLASPVADRFGDELGTDELEIIAATDC